MSSDGVFLRLLKLLRPWWTWIAFSTVLVIIAAPCELFPAIVWRFVTDVVVLRMHESPWLLRWFSFNGLVHSRYVLLASSVTWLFIIYVLGEALGTLEQYILNRMAQAFILRFRNRVYLKLQGQSLGYLHTQRTGDLMSRVMGDIDEIQTFIVNSIDVIFSEGLLWIGTVVFVMLMDWRVASASLAPLIIVYFLLRVFNRKIKPIYTAARDRLGDVSNRLQENLTGLVVIKIFGREKQEARRFYDSTKGYYDQQIKAINARSLFFPFSRVVGFFSNVFMIGVGGYFMLKDGSFTPGDLVAFRSYWWRLFGPIQTLARLNDMVQRANASGRRVFTVLDAPDALTEPADAVAVESIIGNIQLNDVSFRYPNSNAEVLSHVNIKIEPGKTIALCGPSGSGKSTVLNLLLRFYDPTGGQITLDGNDLRLLRAESFRRDFALVQQETFLFNDSILDNIRYGQSDATMDEVIAAAKAANAHGFISSMEKGYDTRVGERGVRLSGGQKQRISIARAFLSNPSVLLLDEPTSSVEPDSEQAIIAALDRLMTGRTTVLTSHRPSLIRQAEYVYVIQNGRVSDEGSLESLLGKSAWFTKFMRSHEAEAAQLDYDSITD